MKLLKKWLLPLLLTLMVPLASWAAISNITGFTTRADGNTITATIWNNELGGIYTYINTNLVAALNTLTTAGDVFVHDGSGLIRLARGNNGDVLTVNTALAHKLNWAAPGGIGLTTTGDTVYYDGGNQRLPIGTAGQVLTVAGGVPTWATNSSNIPTGLISMWSGSIASIPSGWQLCDGTGGTPNLQGLFVVGAGNVSPAATGGMGLISPGGPSGDTSAGTGQGPSHGHTVFNTNIAQAFSSSAVSVTTASGTSSTTVTPRYYALAYIMKL